MKRSSGFTIVQGAMVLIALGLVTALVVVVKSYIAGVDQRAYERGVAETTAKWEVRERTQLQAYQAEHERLRKQMDTALAALQTKLNDAERDYLRRLADEKKQNDRTRADLRAGRLVLVDPGRPAAGEACRGPGAADPAAPAAGDATEGSGLSGEAALFLWAEAERADETAEQLAFAQDVITAYYKLASDCQARR